jgi:hypothetical protein
MEASTRTCAIRRAKLIQAIAWIGLALGLTGIVFASCATTSGKTQELSADAHRREAARSAEAAARERAQFDPHAVATAPLVEPNMAGAVAELASTHNPTIEHLRTAAHLQAHAREHAAAAAELELFEDVECGGITPRVRAACPIVSVVAFKVLPNGVCLHLADPVAEPSTVALMRCHLAYARTRGFERAPDCPLYLLGVEINPASDGRGIEVTSREHAVALEIIRRSLELFR